MRLLSKESIAEITIKELTDEADVHRGTFYHHYRDAFDLKEQVEEEIGQELDEVLSSVPESDGAFELLLRVLRFWRRTAMLPRCWQANRDAQN